MGRWTLHSDGRRIHPTFPIHYHSYHKDPIRWPSFSKQAGFDHIFPSHQATGLMSSEPEYTPSVFALAAYSHSPSVGRRYPSQTTLWPSYLFSGNDIAGSIPLLGQPIGEAYRIIPGHLINRRCSKSITGIFSHYLHVQLLSDLGR